NQVPWHAPCIWRSEIPKPLNLTALHLESRTLPRQPHPEAGAQRTLEGVRWTRLLGGTVTPCVAPGPPGQCIAVPRRSQSTTKRPTKQMVHGELMTVAETRTNAEQARSARTQYPRSHSGGLPPAHRSRRTTRMPPRPVPRFPIQDRPLQGTPGQSLPSGTTPVRPLRG